jgi:hypothetical protein
MMAILDAFLLLHVPSTVGTRIADFLQPFEETTDGSKHCFSSLISRRIPAMKTRCFIEGRSGAVVGPISFGFGIGSGSSFVCFIIVATRMEGCRVQSSQLAWHNRCNPCGSGYYDGIDETLRSRSNRESLHDQANQC